MRHALLAFALLAATAHAGTVRRRRTMFYGSIGDATKRANPAGQRMWR